MGFSFSYHFSFFPRDIFSCSAASSTISPSTSAFFPLYSVTIENPPHPLYVYIHKAHSITHALFFPPPFHNISNAFGCISIYIHEYGPSFLFISFVHIFEHFSCIYKKNFFSAGMFRLHRWSLSRFSTSLFPSFNYSFSPSPAHGLNI